MLLFLLTQLTMIVNLSAAIGPLWGLFGFFGTSGIVTYAVLSQAFPCELAGRVNTALNLLVFITAFACQWGIGAIIAMWPSAHGGYHPHAYQTAFGAVLILQMLAFLWLIGSRLTRTSIRVY